MYFEFFRPYALIEISPEMALLLNNNDHWMFWVHNICKDFYSKMENEKWKVKIPKETEFDHLNEIYVPKGKSENK